MEQTPMHRLRDITSLRRWRPMTWFALALWIGLFAWGNSPWWHQHPASSSSSVDPRGYVVFQEAMADPAYEFTGLSGWPLETMAIDYPTGELRSVRGVHVLANQVIASLGGLILVVMTQVLTLRPPQPAKLGAVDLS